MLWYNRFRLLPPVTGDVHGNLTRGTRGVGLKVLGYNGYGGAGVGVLGLLKHVVVMWS